VIPEIADCCESDVVNTYRVWLRQELFRGKPTNAAFQASEANLREFITRAAVVFGGIDDAFLAKCF
jgi:hypothetical protein